MVKKLGLMWLKIRKSLFTFTKKKKTTAKTGLWVSPPGGIYTTLQKRLFYGYKNVNKDPN
jgi:hypothetical protein